MLTPFLFRASLETHTPASMSGGNVYLQFLLSPLFCHFPSVIVLNGTFTLHFFAVSEMLVL
jgi:hypothetical protein